MAKIVETSEGLSIRFDKSMTGFDHYWRNMYGDCPASYKNEKHLVRTNKKKFKLGKYKITKSGKFHSFEHSETPSAFYPNSRYGEELVIDIPDERELEYHYAGEIKKDIDPFKYSEIEIK